MRLKLRSLILVLLSLGWASPVLAQAPSIVSLTTPFVLGASSTQPSIVVIPITATAAVNTQTTLTIPAPAGGLNNYICSLGYEVGNDNTGTAISNVVSTSTNFNSFAVKFSSPNTASIDSGLVLLFSGTPGGGCAKGTIPGTAVTFVSPSGVTHGAWTWYATFYQAP